MFDISFSELILIGVVALVVIGPERLPKVARTVGLLIGRAQRYVQNVKAEIDREANFEEIKKMQEDARESAMKLEAALKTKAMEYEQKFKEAEEKMEFEIKSEPAKEAEAHNEPEPHKEPQPEEDPRQLKIDFGEK